MSGDPLAVLVEHQLLISRSGFSRCSARKCAWRLNFDWEDADVPEYVGVSHAAHQLELLRGVGFMQAGSTKADVALRRIADEVSLLSVGGLTSGDCGPVWHEPLYPVPRRLRVIESILADGGWK